MHGIRGIKTFWFYGAVPQVLSYEWRKFCTKGYGENIVSKDKSHDTNQTSVLQMIKVCMNIKQMQMEIITVMQHKQAMNKTMTSNL